MSNIENNTPETSNTVTEKNTKWQKILFFVILAAFIALVIVGVVLITKAGGVGRIQESYQNSMNNAIEEAQEEMHQAGQNMGETIYHVANRAVIELGNLQECSELEVLKVRESALNLVTGKNELTDVTSWLEVTETCEFTVDLTKAEFEVDNEEYKVNVRVPLPKPQNFTQENYEQLFSNASIFSGSASDGQTLIEEQIKEADEEIRAKVSTNSDYLEKAKNAAETIIKNAVFALNADIEELEVEVEFAG